MAVTRSLPSHVIGLQVFRGLDIGSAKVGPEITAAVRHHLLDVAEIDAKEKFSVADYCSLASRAIEVR